MLHMTLQMFVGGRGAIKTQPACCTCECWVHRFTRERRKFLLSLDALQLIDMHINSEAVKLLSQALAWLQIMVVSTTAFLVAGRFGLAPTLRQQATSGLRLVDNGTKGLSTGDPSGIQLRKKPFCMSSRSLVSRTSLQALAKLLARFAEVMGSCFCAGFTAVDVLGHGTMGHVIGTGAILSLRVSPSLVACLLAVFEHFCSKILMFACSLQALGKI